MLYTEDFAQWLEDFKTPAPLFNHSAFAFWRTRRLLQENFRKYLLAFTVSCYALACTFMY
jgi:hypothetical protein